MALASTLLMATDVTAPQDLKGATVKVGYFAKMQSYNFLLTMEEEGQKKTDKFLRTIDGIN